MKDNPHPFTPVLASMHHVSDLGHHHWYEVIYHNEEEWCAYYGSDTFQDGETVLDWRYAETCFTNNCPNCGREMKPGYDHICPPPDNHPDICYVKNISEEGF